MTQTNDDVINSVLLDARRQLHELQNSLKSPNVEYSRVLSQISQTTTRLQNAAESINIPDNNASSLIPLNMPPKKNVPIQKPNTNSTPREYRPFKVNKTSKMRRELAQKVQRQHNLPKLKPEDKNLSAAELIALGKIKKYEDAGDLVPMIDNRRDAINAPLFPTIQIDIQGAARSRNERKIKQQEKAAAINQEIQELLINSTQIQKRPSKVSLLLSEEEDFNSDAQSTSQTSPEISTNPRLYEELQDEFAFQTLLIVHGQIARDTPDFESFKRTNQSIWDKIDHILQSIENFCKKYEIQFAEINGRKLSEAALLNIITEDDIHACLVGVDEFIKNKQNSAASIIQNFWRRCLEKREQNERKLLFRAAYSIQTFWRNMTNKKHLMKNIKLKLLTMDQKALELSQSLLDQFSQIEKHPYVVTHVIASQQDLSRCFDLMYRNVELILLFPKLPAAHIWEEFVELLAQCGVMDANERIHFIVLKEGDGVSNRLKCDMKSVQLVRKFICGRNAFIMPHADWSPERTFSVDIGLPIFGVTDTTLLQSRAAIKTIFKEAGIVSTFSTHESRNLTVLMNEALDMMQENPDIGRWAIRLGFTQTDSSTAWFESNEDFLNPNVDLGYLLKQSLHCVGNISTFLGQIKEVGATIDAIPSHIHSFPTVSLFLTGDEIRIVGTFDRLYYAPFRFICNFIPSVSIDHQELITLAKQVGAILLRKKVIGYVMIDFLAFKEDEAIKILGYDIRLNAYPSAVFTAYINLCCGYDPEKNKMLILNSVNCDATSTASSSNTYRSGRYSTAPNGSRSCAKRFSVVHKCLTHPALPVVSSKELKKACFNSGLMFDLRNRTGFRIVFYDTPGEGKGFALSSSITPTLALDKMEKAYSFLLRYLGAKVGSDAGSSIAQTLTSIRHFKSKISL